jgi:hypothetical protein
MDNYKFLSIIDKLDRHDFTKADIIPFKFNNGVLEVSSKDVGQYFMVFLNRDYGDGIEHIDIVTSCDEAKQLVDKLNYWLSEDDFDDDGWIWEW